VAAYGDIPITMSADESGLYWKDLPSRVSIFLKERLVPRNKLSKECLIIMCFIIASVNHKVKFVVIGKAKSHDCTEALKQLVFLAKKHGCTHFQ
jgi:hypothetical protein